MEKIERKFTKTYNLSDYEILTDTGFEDIIKLHETIEYDVYELKLCNGLSLKCADTHIVFDKDENEIFVKDLIKNDEILTSDGVLFVDSVEFLGYKENMYDFELKKNTNHRYFTNDILSHNTETAKIIAEEVFGPNSLIKYDMSEYSEKINTTKFLGSPASYVGYEDTPAVEKVKRKPFSVVLFDEIEKAHPDFYNILLQILDEGHVSDSHGRSINFKNCIIIMTSNIGVKNAISMGKGVGFNTSTSLKEDEAVKNNIKKSMKDKFPPEFLNRISNIIPYNKLSDDNIKKIIEIQLNKLKTRIVDLGYDITWEPSVVDFLLKEAYDPNFGARPIERAIQTFIEDLISEEMLKTEPKFGSIINIKFDDTENKIFITI